MTTASTQGRRQQPAAHIPLFKGKVSGSHMLLMGEIWPSERFEWHWLFVKEWDKTLKLEYPPLIQPSTLEIRMIK